ncbi:hypothetical protein C5167_024396, partial [Papaver somniferum]
MVRLAWFSIGTVVRLARRCDMPRRGDVAGMPWRGDVADMVFHWHNGATDMLEFSAAYHRLRGANVLLPFGFHCTGMPIKASANKLAREIERFGNPPVFLSKEDQIVNKVQEPEVDTSGKTEPDKFKSKKSKAASKSDGEKYQWEIMKEYGLSDAEISKFQDPSHWLIYFPHVAKEDLKAFGLGFDWRRSFITTYMNRYYDSFVRWHIGKLKEMGKIVKDLRASGEGVLPHDYTLIKMKVVAPFPAKIGALEGKRVFSAADTLRHETMYGQTNAWVLAEGRYGAYEINETDVFVVTERAALNLAYQNLSKIPENPTCLVELIGQDLIGSPLRSPLSFNEIIYTLPMMNVPSDKGIGIVTSVPSDSPDDYMTMNDLKSKKSQREKFGMKEEWIMPFQVVPIINIPEFGDKSSEKVCMDLKIKSQNEKEKLAEAKRLTYLKGFTEGTMLVGEFAGMRVQDAKPLIRSKLLENGQAFLVESLSDSTLYMAYYTIAHMLQNGEMYGRDSSLVKPEQMTDEVWKYIFCDGLYPKSSTISQSVLHKMKQEFSYWYPFDLRVSGKDWIQNHLTFTIYNHTKILPQHHWPRVFRCNGHIMLNSEKMSKSTGNFKTLRQTIEDFSADAT